MGRHDASIARWLHAAVADAEARGLPELKGLLEGLAESTRALRDAELGDSPGDGVLPQARTEGEALRPGLTTAERASATNMSPPSQEGNERVAPGQPGGTGRS